MRTCIFGGAGFIGTHLTRCMAQSGREVLVVGRSPRESSCMEPAAKYLTWDALCEDELINLLGSCDELVDLAYATVPKTSFSDPIFDIQANLPFSVRLLQAAVEAGLRRVLVVSSGGTVYGKARYLPIDEAHPTTPLSPYGITKLTIEKYALMFHQIHQLPVVIVRPGNAYGCRQNPSSGQGFVAVAMARIAQGDPVVLFGEKGAVRDYVQVNDLVAGLMAALEQGAPGEVYNIGTGVGHGNLDVIEAICRASAIPLSSVHIERQPFRPFDVPANVLDSGKLTADTGWVPTVSLEQGVAGCWLDLIENTATSL